MSIFVSDRFAIKQRNDLNIMNDCIEALFIEISKEDSGLCKDLIFGIIYRPPNQDVNAFNEYLEKILSQTKSEKKLMQIVGDFNINVLNTDDHIPTSEFSNIMYSHSMLPLITKPTRITSSSATLIDNIYSNNVSDTKILNGLVYTDISDHMPIFSINYSRKIISKVTQIRTRLLNSKNTQSFCNKLVNCDWKPILDNTEGCETFNLFYNKFETLKTESIYQSTHSSRNQ